MIKLDNITKSYGHIKALNKLCINIRENAIYGVLGQHGAGKTTAIKILAGLLSYDGGMAQICGIDVNKNRSKINELVGYIPDRYGYYQDITVEEYMEFFASCYGMRGAKALKRADELIDRVNLGNKKLVYIDNISKDMKQRLFLARALIHEPKILLIDEPINGLDLRINYEFKEILKQLNAEGKTIVICASNLSELSGLCSDVGIVESGSMIVEGSVSDVLRKVSGSNPIKIVILEGEAIAKRILMEDRLVKHISLDNHTYMVGYEGSEEDEARLIVKLISQGVLIKEFIRKEGNLESFFMQIRKNNEEKVIMENDY